MPSQPGPSRADPAYAVILTSTQAGVRSFQTRLTLTENEELHDAFMCFLHGPGRHGEFNEAALVIVGPDGEELVHIADAYRQGDLNAGAYQWNRGTALNAVFSHLRELGWRVGTINEVNVAKRVRALRDISIRHGLTPEEAAEYELLRQMTNTAQNWLRPGVNGVRTALLSEAQIEGRMYRIVGGAFAIDARKVAETIDHDVGTENAKGAV